MSSTLLISLETISCFLSLLGSSCVALTWAYPVENRRKHGRILLLWLSISDFMASIVYAIQSLSTHKTTSMCKTLALLGIFFQVASFLWTDFIAFYLYLVVVQRSNKLEWSTLLKIFHLVAWVGSGIVVLFVGVYDRAGNASVGDDDAIYSDSGSWCWIAGTDQNSQFIWELVGGKVIEWLSCLIVLPYFYCSVRQKLKNWDTATVLTTTNAPLRAQSSPGYDSNSSRKQISSNVSNSAGASASGAVSKPSEVSSDASGEEVTGTVNRIMDNNQRTISVVSNDSSTADSKSNKTKDGSGGSSIFKSGGHDDQDNDEESLERSKYACEDLSEGEHRDSSFVDKNESGLKLKAVNGNGTAQSGRSDLLPVMIKNVKSGNDVNARGLSMVSRSAGKKRELFSQFYTKLLALPLVFLFIRTWGSLRVILAFADYRNKPALQFFDVMQAFFDPSQGFFNAILFVFLSPEDRTHLLLSLGVVCAYIGSYFAPCNKLSACFANEADVKKEMRRVEKYQSHQRQQGDGRSRATSRAASNLGVTAAGNTQLTGALSPGGRSSRSSSFGGISFEDESMFECDDANRISDFSFESRVDADNREFP